jgi:hypothetical protein
MDLHIFEAGKIQTPQAEANATGGPSTIFNQNAGALATSDENLGAKCRSNRLNLTRYSSYAAGKE